MDTKKFWQYNHQHKWSQTDKPLPESLIDISDFLQDQDYLPQPDIVLGDELNFLAVYEHPFKEEYLFHLIIDDFAKIMYSNSLPGMLELLQNLTHLVREYFETLNAVQGVDECSD
jgi:hypothetical protein